MVQSKWSPERVRRLSLPVATISGVFSLFVLGVLLLPNAESGLVIIPIFVLPAIISVFILGIIRMFVWGMTRRR
jgi:hypothetical protein